MPYDLTAGRFVILTAVIHEPGFHTRPCSKGLYRMIWVDILWIHLSSH